MKATTIAVFGLAATSVCAQPIIIPREYDTPALRRTLAELEARGWPHININWKKVGDWAKNAVKHVDWGKVGKTAAKVAVAALLRREDVDELFARDYIYMNPDLAIRDVDGNGLEERDLDDYLEQRDLDLELRDEQENKEWPPFRPPPRFSRNGDKVGQGRRLGKSWGDERRPHRDEGNRRRPWGPGGNLDDLD